MHRAAKQAFDKLGAKKIPSIKSLSDEYSALVSQKKKLYSDYRKVRDEMRELLVVKANMDEMLQIEAQQKEQEMNRNNVR